MTRLTEEDIHNLVVGDLITYFENGVTPALVEEVIRIYKDEITIKVKHSHPDGFIAVGVEEGMAYEYMYKTLNYKRTTDEHIRFIKVANTRALISNE